jgi:DNA repair protein RadC
MEDNPKHLNIKSLAEDDRPREKMAGLGRHAISDAELLAIILGSGNRSESAVQLAQRILADHQNSINRLARCSVKELQRFKGIGEVKAVTIAAAFELGRRRKIEESPERVKISTSHHAYDILRKRLEDLPHEEFWVLLLNRANQVTQEIYLSKGGIAGTVVDVRIICKSALENNASGLVIAHNHPSGEVRPSEQDISITRKLKEGLKLFDLSLIDHLIIGDRKYLSFADEGML